jgi:DNA adenine methylase
MTRDDLRPPLKWAGGKRWLVPRLQALRPDPSRRLVEPFCGGLAIALGLQPAQALLNDVNPHLINFYRQVQTGLILDLEMRNERQFYYDCRDRFNDLIARGEAATAEAAQLFYYLNRTGFNGLCRFNRRGGFNVPFGRYLRPDLDYRRDLSALTAAMQGWTFRCGDFARMPVEPEDWVYADPPYDCDFTQYSAAVFGWEEQLRLAHWLAGLGVPVVASNQATPRILELYGDLGFRLEVLEAPRRIACNGDRTPALEMLAYMMAL